ncbi:MAG: glycosyltransferase family 4 protein [Candidatus Eisenbacteria sp.]|nr:glycosyltransferase family 4 protein [Candidatus Eisenbacteria bacterium]
MARSEARHLVFFSDCPYYGGAEAYLALLAEARPTPAWRLSALVPAGPSGEVLAERLTAADVRVVRYAVGGWVDPRFWRRLTRLLRELGGEVLHLNLPSVYDARLSVPAVLAKRSGYRRVVTTEHLPMVERARRRMLAKILISTAIDAIIVHTDWNRERLAHYHHMPWRKMVVIPNGSAEPPAGGRGAREALRGRLGLAEGNFAIAMVGRLTERKGHRFLLEALAQLKRDGSGAGWRLLVVGEGEEAGPLAELARGLQIGEETAFLGYRDDACEIIGASDLLVLPSLMETQPLVLTEAMAAGRPVIASAIYGIPEIVADGETGCLVPAGEVAPLAAAIERLVDDRSLARRLGEAGRRRYEERFTLRQMAERTYAVLAGGCSDAVRAGERTAEATAER